jgi:hypothetical protein
MVGKVGVEPTRLAAQDPKSCLSANSSTPPEDTATCKQYNRKSLPIS